MRTSLRRFLFLTLMWLLLSGPSFAQSVAYSGKLQIGFSDQDNVTGFRSNNAVPICAGGGELVNPGTIGTTLGTLLINAEGSGAPGVGGALTFHAVGGGHGGAQQRITSTCNVAIPGFANPRLRSRTQVGSAYFPGRKGLFTPNIHAAPVPTTPTATYMLSALGGNLQPGSVTAWTTVATGSAPAVSHTGSAIEQSLPFFGVGLGVERIQPGPARFGGAMPYSGGGGVQLGINFITHSRQQRTHGGGTLEPGDYGIALYANGFLAFGPQFFGTAAKGVNIVSPITTTLYSVSFMNTIGLIQGRHDLTYAARTPGGSTQHQQGAIRTLAGGNTASPAVTPPAPPIISPVAYSGFFGEWTTGKVTHTDRIGDFITIRKASGFDIVPAASTQISNETRRLQVVTPWAATIRPIGPFGLPIPSLGFGGIALMTVNVIPTPEPGMIGTLLAGIAGLAARSTKRSRMNRLS